ncbi:MAG: hypothetical protein HON98_07265 [Chloroflexi bacterium]|jgi:hypothetical protein|nr:hypothetical protein [Chloroflexota bacterium]MBT3669742.1 hypothetical protein [Chloroflexota bacterium]MBT4003432.1 hypothetical protein [Chloroflexota bacterium]MBT4305222.1 hypothetical protein [Chloroflexota bacterium]MBT4534855.1 hypothetical protein [Chloroflexota bacterium]
MSNKKGYSQANALIGSFFDSFKWTKSSYAIFSSFILLILIIMYVWWPLVVEYFSYFREDISIWVQMDKLLIGIFLFMSLMIMAQADIKKDLPIILIGLAGGLVIESWGTQTELWTYYTNERPPLWIIPAWPIASLSIDRLYRIILRFTKKIPEKVFTILHWFLLPGFFMLMLVFIWPTIGKSLTMMALIFSVFLILTPKDHRSTVLVFIAGSGLGYFLELWGTTRLCWTYYTLEQPPIFAVFAHGMAAVGFWRVYKLFQLFSPKFNLIFSKKLKIS